MVCIMSVLECCGRGWVRTERERWMVEYGIVLVVVYFGRIG